MHNRVPAPVVPAVATGWLQLSLQLAKELEKNLVNKWLTTTSGLTSRTGEGLPGPVASGHLGP